MTTTVKKISCSLPEPLVRDLDLLAVSLGVSRSALLSGLLFDGVTTMAGFVRDAQSDTSPDHASTKRAVSSALDDISASIKELQDHVGTQH